MSRGALARRDSAAVFSLVALLYLLGFLFAIGDLNVRPEAGLSLFVVDDPLSRMVEPGPGPFAYEGVATIDLLLFRYLLSPVNLAIGLGLSLLVGLNLALSYLAITQPKSCGIGTSTGVLASVPALVSGTACCAPVVFLVFGIQASAALLTVFVWLLPIGVVFLVGSLAYVSTEVDPTALGTAPGAR
ncbi:hypothetical protein [Natronorarus salvus]|uniref:hypothetical protein n=1 Tax=Natronorarus salvus TaxID=3117733 RepID=UPI002F268387